MKYKELSNIIKKAIYSEIYESLDDIPEENKNGDCYIQAYHYFMSNCHSNKNLRLVHGLVEGKGRLSGIRFNHAWCEDIKLKKVIDKTFPKALQELPTIVYYSLGNVTNPHKYDLNDVTKFSIEEGTYGPWDKKLKQNEY